MISNEPLFSERTTFFVNVILPLAIGKSYTYRVPEEFREQIAVGKRVIVQFGKNKVYSALIEEIHTNPPKIYEAKYILNVLDEQPVIHSEHLRFWDWIASYYMCRKGEVMQAALPSALKLSSETSIVLKNDYPVDKEELNDREYLIMEALEIHGRLSMNDTYKILEQKNVYSVVRSLLDKRIVCVEEEIEDRYKPRLASFVMLHGQYKDRASLPALFAELERAPKQVDLLQKYMQLCRDAGEIEKKKLLDESGISAAVLQALIKKEVFISYEKTVSRLRMDDAHIPDTFELSEAQQQACTDICGHFAENKVTLLHGVTSSGKTQVYIRLIEKAIGEGKQVLFLLPEIALTAQIINRLRKYFGAQVGIYHSKFNDNERVEVWNKVLDGSYRVVLGTRSALFLPFKDLGLVIVDEEHENSYKQYDPAPRYHARDAAIYLAAHHQASILLGSATPSVETYFHASSGKYALVELNERYGGVLMPEIGIADLKYESQHKTMESHFSSFLLKEMARALQAKEQVILFQNRRGYAPMLSCTTCGFTPKCIHCDVSLTYHKLSHQLHCHYCGYRQQPLKVCPACGSSHLEMKGFGTEKLEDDLALLYPEARIARMDLDSTKAKNAFHQLLSDLEDRKIDILVGTQMVAKGLDFEHVSLIGIIHADAMLNYPDFRAYERSFQLMEQVSGRAGRRSKTGKVVIQTYQPEHEIIRSVVQHDYKKMFNREIAERRQFKYPPFTRMITLEIKHKNPETMQKASAFLAAELRRELKDRVLGPEAPLVSRIRNYYIHQIQIKLERNGLNLAEVKDFLRSSIELMQSEKEFRQALVVTDVDPA